MQTQRIAIVTGASRGIGNAIAVTIAREGYHILTIGNSPEEKVREGLDTISAQGVQVVYVQGSIDDEDARGRLLAAAEAMGGLDLLVNNAAMAPRVRTDILEMTTESFLEVLHVNLVGTFLLTQAAANIMVAQAQKDNDRRMAIVNIGSVSADTVSLNRAEYCVSKAAMGMATQLFAVRLAEYNIPVFEIRPGIIHTDMITPVKEKYDKLIADGLTPIKRMGLPEDVANAVRVLARGDLTYATGQVLYIDGGLHIRRL